MSDETDIHSAVGKGESAVVDLIDDIVDRETADSIQSKQDWLKDSEHIVRNWQNVCHGGELAYDVAYSYKTSRRDAWLAGIWKKVHIWKALVESEAALNANRTYHFWGGRRGVRMEMEHFQCWHTGPGQYGSRNGREMLTRSYLTQDLGGVIETPRPNNGDFIGALQGFAHVDPSQCNARRDLNYPLEYKNTPWGNEDYWQFINSADTREKYLNVGYCATSSVIDLLRLVMGVEGYYNEKLTAAPPKGFLFFQNISENNLIKALNGVSPKMTGKMRQFFKNVIFFAGTHERPPDAKLIGLSQLPENFNYRDTVEMVVIIMHMILGRDVAENYPLRTGAGIGRATEAQVQHFKATHKAGASLLLKHQEMMNDPYFGIRRSVWFEYEQRDDEGQILKLKRLNLAADLIKKVVEIAPNLSEEAIFGMLVEKGIINPEDTPFEEETVQGDTVKARSLLDRRRDFVFNNERLSDHVQWLRKNRFSDDIVHYSSASIHTAPKMLFAVDAYGDIVDRRGEALFGHQFLVEHAIVRSIPEAIIERAVVYQDEDEEVVITDKDIEEAIEEAAERVEPLWGELMDAEIYEGDEDDPEERSIAHSYHLPPPEFVVRSSYGWDNRVKNYRNLETGRLIAKSKVRTMIESSLTASADATGTLAEMVAEGTITAEDWRDQMRQEVKKEYIRQYLVPVGGRDRMTQADWGRIGGMLREQYRYLDNFYEQVADGNLSVGQIKVREQSYCGCGSCQTVSNEPQCRAAMYAKSAREASERAFAQTAEATGSTQERRVLNAQESCPDCIVLANKGWSPFGSLPFPGDGSTVCLTNCKCTKEYR